MAETDTLIKTTCPRDCYDACGMSVRVRGGVIQNVMGDRDHHVSQGKLCGKCAIAYNGVFRDAEQAPVGSAAPRRAKRTMAFSRPSPGRQRLPISRRG